MIIGHLLFVFTSISHLLLRLRHKNKSTLQECFCFYGEGSPHGVVFWFQYLLNRVFGS